MCWQQPPPLLVPALVHVLVLFCSEPDWVPAVCYVCALCGKYFVLSVALFRGRPCCCCCCANSTGEKAGRRGSCCPSLLHRGGRASLAAAVLILPARRQAGRAVDSRIPPARRLAGLAVAVLIPRVRSQTDRPGGCSSNSTGEEASRPHTASCCYSFNGEGAGKPGGCSSNSAGEEAGTPGSYLLFG